MKEIGNILKEKRVENGVSISEAAEDLNIDDSALENLEEGNVRAFKDMYVLKELIKDYAKYLGLDVNDIVEEFNDFLFEHTTKISLDDIKVVKSNQQEKKIVSPYTQLPKLKRDYRKLIKPLTIILVILILFIIIGLIVKKDEKRSVELKKDVESVIYEFTY